MAKDTAQIAFLQYRYINKVILCHSTAKHIYSVQPSYYKAQYTVVLNIRICT